MPLDPDDFDVHQEERLWPTTEEAEEYDPDGYDPEDDFGLADDDGEALASAGFGTDEDYNPGMEDEWLDASYEE